MLKNLKLVQMIILTGIILLISNAVLLSYAEESQIATITIEAFPNTGDITSDILVKVIGVPYICGGPLRRCYVYFDGKNVASGVVPVDTGGRASWDVTFKVPNETPYSNLGEHTIKAFVEASDGTSATATTTFNVVNYIQPPEWWRNLPSEFVQMITGPAGAKGATGAQGPKGDPGTSAPMEYIYASMGVSALAIIIALIAMTRRR